jgi:hypothetical protein
MSRAPHLPVARDARLDSRLLAEQQVLSPPSEEQHSFSDTLVSHPNARLSCRGRLLDLHAARNQDGGPGQLQPLVRWPSRASCESIHARAS